MKVNFNERLKELRLEKNMTQKQLADIFNVGRVSITDWETRGNEPSYQTLADLAKFFDVTVGQLLGVEDY